PQNGIGHSINDHTIKTKNANGSQNILPSCRYLIRLQNQRQMKNRAAASNCMTILQVTQVSRSCAHTTGVSAYPRTMRVGGKHSATASSTAATTRRAGLSAR